MASRSPRIFTIFSRNRISWSSGFLIAFGAVVLTGACTDSPAYFPIRGSDAGSSSGATSGSTSSGGSGAASGASGSSGSGSSGAASGAGASSGNGGTSDAGNEGGESAGDDGSADGGDGAAGCPFDPTKASPGVCGCGVPDNASGDVTGDGGIDCVPGHYYEAENGTLSSTKASVAWTIGSDPNAAGGKYIVSPSEGDDTQAGPALATYTLHIPADGMYVIWGRFYAPDVNSDRVWMRVDSSPFQKLRGTTGDTWHWFHFHKEGDWDNPIQFQLTMGDHTLDMANDAPGNKIDRFYVTSAGDTPKPGPGEDTTCNPPHTILKGGACVSSCGTLMGNSCDPVACRGQTSLPAYDCTVCCQLPAADAGADAAADAGTE